MSLHVVVAGSSGFLGTHLTAALQRQGHRVTCLVRRPAEHEGESTWDPYSDVYDRDVIESADVVVNLAGAPLVGNVHSKRWAQDVLESRVTTTRLLARAIAESERPAAYLAGNGIAIYGSQGDAAREAGARVVVLRTSPVMDRRSAPLGPLTLLFKSGLGGKLGKGTQHMPMISLRDWVGAVLHLAADDDAHGPVNLCCVDTPTNAEFTRTLASAVHRPAFARVPAKVLEVAAGPMAPELLGSVNARPQALLDQGFVFRDPDVRAVVQAGLQRLDP